MFILSGYRKNKGIIDINFLIDMQVIGLRKLKKVKIMIEAVESPFRLDKKG
ncbi:hypothetical protein V7201_16990 [Bacillus sp. JJ1122]